MFTQIIRRTFVNRHTKCLMGDFLKVSAVSVENNDFSTRNIKGPSRHIGSQYGEYPMRPIGSSDSRKEPLEILLKLAGENSQGGKRNLCQKVELFSERDHEEFSSFFPELVETLTDIKPWNTYEELRESLTVILEKNVHFWTNCRGVATIRAYKVLEKPENLTEENIKLATILAWCGRLFEAAIVITDDIVDHSETRGTAPCWYKNEDVGMRAIIDAVYVENSVYQVLKKYFSNHPQYLKIVEAFHDCTFTMMMGQSLDLLPYDLKKLNMDYYKLVCWGKGAPMFFFIPMVLRLANFSEELQDRVVPIIDSLGIYYQIQNDYLDCYGDPSLTGKIGTDIIKGTCSWLAVKTMEMGNSTQRTLMKEMYGRKDQKSVEIIRNLYNELKLEEVYKEYELEAYGKIHSDIAALPSSLNHEFFFSVLDAIKDQKWPA